MMMHILWDLLKRVATQDNIDTSLKGISSNGRLGEISCGDTYSFHVTVERVMIAVEVHATSQIKSLQILPPARSL